MKKLQGRKKEVKSWAIVTKRVGVIETADYFVDNECPAAESCMSLAIYETEQIAKLMNRNEDTHEVVRATIIYTLPKKNNLKRT